MQTIKSGLYALLGRQGYLRLVNRLYRLAFRSGWLRRDPDYAFHYYVRRLVKPGDFVIDIGANLGYFSMIFADLIGSAGRLWSVEPVPLYRAILEENLRRFSQATVVPFALGDEPGEVQMGVPGEHPYRHGLTRILSMEEAGAVGHSYRVRVRTPEELFDSLPRLDYVKCDVEGYEGHILPLMTGLFRRHRPMVQVELARENRAAIFALFTGLGYQPFALSFQTLYPLPNAAAPAAGDVLFVPQEKTPGVAMPPPAKKELP